jgi:hypothetical protein
VIAFWLEILHGVHKGSNNKYSTAERLEAFGKPPQAIMGHLTEARKQVLESAGFRRIPMIARGISSRSLTDGRRG